MNRMLLICVIGVLTGTSATAAELPWYVKFEAGSSSAVNAASSFRDGLRDVVPPNAIDRSSTIDDTDVSWSIAGGYQLSPHFSVELAYVDHGDFEFRHRYRSLQITNSGAFFVPRTLTDEIESYGFALSAQARYPLGKRFDLHARLGVESMVTQLTRVTDFAPEESEQKSLGAMYGAGVSFQLTSAWAATLDWTRQDNLDDDSTGLDYDIFTIGVSHRLGESNAKRSPVYLSLQAGTLSADLAAESVRQIVHAVGQYADPFRTTLTDDHHEFVRGISLGYEVSRHVALEAGYVDFGRQTFVHDSRTVLPITGAIESSVGRFDVQTAAWTAKGQARLPLWQRFDIHLGAGVARATTRSRSTGEIRGQGYVFRYALDPKQSSTSNDLFYGAGVRYNLLDNIALSLDWQRFADLGDAKETVEADYDATTLSFVVAL